MLTRLLKVPSDLVQILLIQFNMFNVCRFNIYTFFYILCMLKLKISLITPNIENDK